MVSITFIHHDGGRVLVDVEPGDNLMEIARDSGVDGILAECGGACACATCHIVINLPYTESFPEKSAEESMVLEGALNLESGSRLACQLSVTEEMDGMTISVPQGFL